MQRLSAERQRGTLEPARRAHAVSEVVAEEERSRGSVELEPVQQQVQVQQQAQAPQITQHELEFQEQLIAERENEIREIESGIHELNDIFRDIGAIVEQQGGLVGESLTPWTCGAAVRVELAQPPRSAIQVTASCQELPIAYPRQHREQHHLRVRQHARGRRGTHDRARVPAQGGAAHGVSPHDPRHRHLRRHLSCKLADGG